MFSLIIWQSYWTFTLVEYLQRTIFFFNMNDVNLLNAVMLILNTELNLLEFIHCTHLTCKTSRALVQTQINQTLPSTSICTHVGRTLNWMNLRWYLCVSNVCTCGVSWMAKIMCCILFCDASYFKKTGAREVAVFEHLAAEWSSLSGYAFVSIFHASNGVR